MLVLSPGASWRAIVFETAELHLAMPPGAVPMTESVDGTRSRIPAAPIRTRLFSKIYEGEKSINRPTI